MFSICFRCVEQTCPTHRRPLESKGMKTRSDPHWSTSCPFVLCRATYTPLINTSSTPATSRSIGHIEKTYREHILHIHCTASLYRETTVSPALSKLAIPGATWRSPSPGASVSQLRKSYTGFVREREGEGEGEEEGERESRSVHGALLQNIL